MSKFAVLLLSASAMFATAASADDTVNLPTGPVQNFIGGFAPIAAGLGIFMAGILDDETTSTTSTTAE